MSKTLYARVPDSVKSAVDAHADERGITLALSVAELLERGLVAWTDGPAISKLEERVESLQRKLTDTRLQLQQAELQIEALHERERSLANAQQSLAERMQLVVGRCTACAGDVRGRDLLVAGVCPSCAAPLTSLLTGRAQGKNSIKQDEFLLVLGAVGVLLGVALLASKS